MQASEALRDIVSGRKHAEREGKNEGYDDNLVYSRFLQLRRRFSEEDEPIVLGQTLKERPLP